MEYHSVHKCLRPHLLFSPRSGIEHRQQSRNTFCVFSFVMQASAIRWTIEHVFRTRSRTVQVLRYKQKLVHLSIPCADLHVDNRTTLFPDVAVILGQQELLHFLTPGITRQNIRHKYATWGKHFLITGPCHVYLGVFCFCLWSAT